MRSASKAALPPEPADGSDYSAGEFLELGDPLGTEAVDDAAKFLDPRAEPGQFVGADPVMFRVTRLHIGFLELFPPGLVDTPLARPDINQAAIQALGLGAQEANIVNMLGLCRAPDYAERARHFGVFQGF